MLTDFLCVGLGGAVGAMMRYGITVLFAAMQWSGNLGTFITNVAGSCLMGLLVSTCSQSPWLLMATVGVCGGFTTFSTFSMQSLTLLQQGRYGMAALYVAGSACACVLSAYFGWYMGERIR